MIGDVLGKLARYAASALAPLASGVLLCASGCGQAAKREPPPFDCTADDKFQLTPPPSSGLAITTEDFESGGATWYGYGDATPGATHTYQIDGGSFPTEPIPGGRCGSQMALVLRSQGHSDYGSGFGDYHPFDDDFSRTGPANATDWEGIAFWARSPGDTDKSVWLSWSDVTVDAEGGYCISAWNRVSVLGAYVGAAASVEAGVDEDSGAFPVGASVAAFLGPDGGAAADSGIAPEKACGNGFRRLLTTTEDWQFYALPFESFHQDPLPTLIPTGIDRSTLYRLTIQVPKEARLELWIDDLGLYQRASE
jgi:hypothetical protein